MLGRRFRGRVMLPGRLGTSHAARPANDSVVPPCRFTCPEAPASDAAASELPVGVCHSRHGTVTHGSTTGRLGPARQVVTSPSTDSDRSPLPYRVSPMIATGFSYDQSEAQLALSLTCILRCQSRGQRASARVSGFKSRVKFTEVAGAA